MFLTRTPATIFGLALLSVLAAISFRTSTSATNELSILMEPDGTGVWREIIDRFNAAHSGPPVRLVEGPAATNTREDMYATAFLAGESGHDIVYCDVVWVPKFAAAGWLLDLTDRVAPDDREDFLQADLDAGTYNGRIYRIPAFTDAGLLYYRSDLVKQPPRSFEELLMTASSLQTDTRWGYVWQGKQYEGLVTNYLEILWGHGGEWITPDRQVYLDRPEALDALLFMKSTIGSISPPGVTTYIEDDTRNLFQSGRSVFLRNWLYVSRLVDLSQSEVKGRIGFVPMPHAPGSSSAASLGGWGFAISSRSPNPEAAWTFVRFVTSPEQLKLVQSRVGRVPARKSLVPLQFQQIVANARPRPPIPEYAQASDILQRRLSAALAGAEDPREALLAASRETRALLD
jgi:multiple sugar transport system substrate-binding protein